MIRPPDILADDDQGVVFGEAEGPPQIRDLVDNLLTGGPACGVGLHGGADAQDGEDRHERDEDANDFFRFHNDNPP